MFRQHRPRASAREGYRHWPAALGAGMIAAIALPLPLPAAAQNMAELQRELAEMRRHYDAGLKRLQRDYDSRIRRLETQLKAAQKAPSPSAPVGPAEGSFGPVATAVPPPAPPLALAAPAAPPAARPGLTIGTPPGEPWAIGPVTPPRNPATSASAFNPSIGIILDGRLSAFSQNPDRYFIKGFVRGDEAGPGVRGFSIGESEINFSATVDPYFFGNLTLALSPENEVAVEEAFLQTTSLPWGLTLRGGRFFSGIGYINQQHAHTWDFADQALPYRAFLNTQYGDDGVQLRWLAPTRQFLEFGGELFRGAAFPAAGAPNSGIGTHSLFAHTGGDIDDNSSYRTGVSWLRTKAVDRENARGGGYPGTGFTGKDDTLIADAVFKWAPNGNPVETNLKLQGEFFARNERGSYFRPGRIRGLEYDEWQTGFYTQAIYQFMPRWRLGLRYDQLFGNHLSGVFAGTKLDSDGVTPRRASAMLEYNTSEFGRVRLQYNHDWSRGTPDSQAILQYTISLGAHGAHLY